MAETDTAAPAVATSLALTVNPATVKMVQTKLRDSGFYATGPIDGELTPKGMTEAAILDFRNKNGLPLTPGIDVDFLTALFNAPAATVSSDRAAVTAADIREMPESVVAPQLTVNHWQKIGGILVGGFSIFWSVFDGVIDNLGGATDKLAPVKDLLGDLPAWGWGLVVFVVAGGIYFAAHHNEQKTVEAVRKGAVT